MKKYLLLILLVSCFAFAKAQGSDTTSKNGVYTDVQKPAQFPGGMDELGSYIGHHLQYPQSAKDAKIQGKVIISFVVEKDGTVSTFKIIHSLTKDCDAEVIRVFKSAPKWKPAKQDNVIVRQEFTIPVSFNLPVDN